MFARLKDLCTSVGRRWLGFCRIDGGCVRVGGAHTGDFCAGRLTGGLGGGGLVDLGFGLGVVGDLRDHAIGVCAESNAADVADGGVEGAEDEFGAFEFDGAAKQGIDDLDEGGLDGFLVFK